MRLFHCNEKGMRLESATVPAAVMPDPALTRDEGFLNTCHCGAMALWEGSENRDKSEDLPDNLIFKAFGKKSAGSLLIPHLIFLAAPDIGLC
jgi:hypothetical protein